MGKVLLTGAKGFIGKNILLRLIEDGHNVVCKYKEDFNGLGYNDLDLSDIDAVLHIGAISSTDADDPNELFSYNYAATKSLIDACKRDRPVNPPHFVFASSASIYGNYDNLGGRNWYAWTKKCCEDYGWAVLGKNFTVLRYFNVYGPGESHKGSMASVAYQAMKHQLGNHISQFSLFKSPEDKPIKRDFVYIDDVVDATIHAMWHGSGGVHEVGTGEARSFEDVLDILEIPYKIPYTNEGLSTGCPPKWYQYHTESFEPTWMDGWKPKVSLEQGLAKYKEWFKQEHNESLG